jgi:hypothetical protein
LATVKSQATSFAKTAPISISKEEYKLLELLSCKKKSDLAIHTIKTYTMADYEVKNNKRADIDCQSHEKFMGSESHYTFYCEKLDSPWKCEEGPLKILVDIKNRNVNLYLSGITPVEAYNGLSKISNLWFQGESIDELI